MEKHRDKLRYASIVLLCLLNLGFGISVVHPPMVLGGAIGLIYVATAATKGRGAADSPIELAQS
jgi:hypothetical protein